MDDTRTARRVGSIINVTRDEKPNVDLRSKPLHNRTVAD
jgi:hypothetical protein